MGDEIPVFQHKPKKSLNYELRIKAGHQPRWKRRTPLKTVSKSRSKEAREYASASRLWLGGKSCEVCGQQNHLSIHHKKGRIGKLLNDKRWWMCACLIGSEDYLKEAFPDANHCHSGGCHGFIEANANLAREKGWKL